MRPEEYVPEPRRALYRGGFPKVQGGAFEPHESRRWVAAPRTLVVARFRCCRVLTLVRQANLTGGPALTSNGLPFRALPRRIRGRTAGAYGWLFVPIGEVHTVRRPNCAQRYESGMLPSAVATC